MNKSDLDRGEQLDANLSIGTLVVDASIYVYTWEYYLPDNSAEHCRGYRSTPRLGTLYLHADSHRCPEPGSRMMEEGDIYHMGLQPGKRRQNKRMYDAPLQNKSEAPLTSRVLSSCNEIKVHRATRSVYLFIACRRNITNVSTQSEERRQCTKRTPAKHGVALLCRAFQYLIVRFTATQRHDYPSRNF